MLPGPNATDLLPLADMSKYSLLKHVMLLRQQLELKFDCLQLPGIFRDPLAIACEWRSDEDSVILEVAEESCQKGAADSVTQNLRRFMNSRVPVSWSSGLMAMPAHARKVAVGCSVGA